MSRRAQRLPVLVNAVQGKIGLVLRPLPVVLVSAEGRHRHRRRPHQANVGINVIQAQIVLCPGPHAGKPGFHAILLLVFRLHDGGDAPAAGRLALGGEFLLQSLHLVGDVQHLAQEVEVELRDGDLIGPGMGPETVFQVIVLRGGEGGHVAVGAVVVGDHEAVLRDHAAGAVKAQRHDGVREAARLLIIDLPGAQLEPPCLHVLLQRPVQALYQPHAFVGPCTREDAQGQQKGYEQAFSHCVRSGGRRRCGSLRWWRCRCIRLR